MPGAGLEKLALESQISAQVVSLAFASQERIGAPFEAEPVQVLAQKRPSPTTGGLKKGHLGRIALPGEEVGRRQSADAASHDRDSHLQSPRTVFSRPCPESVGETRPAALFSRTQPKTLATLSTGVVGRIPWPRLKM